MHAAYQSSLKACSIGIQAEVAHLVEHQPSKLRVAGSSPVFRSIKPRIMPQFKAAVAQLVECVLGKDEVTGSNPVVGSKKMIKIEILITHYLTIK